MKNQIIFFTIFFAFLSSLNLYGQDPVLMPVPQKVTWGKGKFQLADAKLLISPELFQREKSTINQFIAYVKQNTGLSIVSTYSEDPGAHLIVLISDQTGQPLPLPGEKSGNQSREGYRINITPDRVQIKAKTDAGIFYSLQTLRQLIVAGKSTSYLPEADLEDYPEFAYRGVMIDFSHGGLLTEEEIKNQIDFLSRWKMNQYYFSYVTTF